MTAEEIGELASRLRFGLYAHSAILQAIRDPSAPAFVPRGPTPAERRSSEVLCKDGTSRAFDWHYALDLANSDPDVRGEMDRAWCVSSLILLGDRLGERDYFDRAPVLEMVRHLRNGVAHGNRFTIRNPSELSTWPAHTLNAACQSGETFVITPELDGSPVLFDFMAVGDVLDLLVSVSTYLLRDHYGR